MAMCLESCSFINMLNILTCTINKLYSKSGQNGTWGQNGTPGVLEKSLPGVGLFSPPFDFCRRPVERHTSKLNLQYTTL